MSMLSQSYRPVRILVMDEDPEMLKMTRVFLKKQGYEIETANTEKTAFRYLTSGFFDVVLLSLDFNSFDSRLFAETLQNIWPTQKIILMSENNNLSARQVGEELGIEQLIDKPLSVKKLNKAVKKLCKLPSKGGSEAVPFQQRDLTGELTTLQRSTGRAFAHQNYARLFDEFAQDLSSLIPCISAGVLGLTDIYNCLFSDSIQPITEDIRSEVMMQLEKTVFALTEKSLPDNLQIEEHINPSSSTGNFPQNWSLLTAPVTGENGKLEAVVYVILPGKFAENKSESNALYLAAHHLSTLLQALRSNQKNSMWDGVTGLHNRQYLDESIPRIWKIAQTNKYLLGIICIDLDGFTEINNQYGYIKGDAIMKLAAERIQAELTPADLLVRLRGDKFQVLLTHTTQDALQKTGNRIYTSFKEEPLILDNKPLAVTATVAGAMGGTDLGVTSSQQLIDCAEQVRFRLKKEGGNAVAFWNPESTLDDRNYEKRNLLLVDDDPVVPKLVTKMLAKEMVEITSVENVEKAEALLTSGQRFEIMITDISMPGRDGFDMLAIASKIDPNMVRIVTSGNISKRTEQLLEGAGSEGILRKPFNAHDLRNCVSSAIETYVSR